MFSGFGGADLGMIAAGLKVVWSIEKHHRVAEVAENNLGHLIYAKDVLDVNPRKLAPVDFVHASPPCPSFSLANPEKREKFSDMALAERLGELLYIVRPKVFTLENVTRYRHSQSWGIIAMNLEYLGYQFDMKLVNFADYGVPQTRRRMIVRAVQGKLPPWPELEPRPSWYDATWDLLEDLPHEELSSFQKKHLPDPLTPPMLLGNGAMWGMSLAHAKGCKPAMTVTSNHNQLRLMAWLGNKTVRLPLRALARLQTFPDSFKLPDNAPFAVKGLGNATPPEGMKRIFQGLMEGT